MRFDLVHPTRRQVREGLVSGLVAESIAIPVLITAFIAGKHPDHWGYVLAALACFFVSIVYLAFFVAVTKGKFSANDQANAAFVVVCLAMSALAFIALGSADRFGVFTPAVLVGVTFISIVGDRTMRVAVDAYAIALVVIIGWAQGLRGTDLAGGILVFASTIVIITWIIARTVGELNRSVNFRSAVEALNERLAEREPGDAESSTAIVRRIFERGLPLVTRILPSHNVVVFARSGKREQCVPLVTWNADQMAVLELAELPEVDQALRADVPVLTDTHCAIPVGYCAEGELVMVTSHRPGTARRPRTGRRGCRTAGRGLPPGHQPGQLRERPPHREPDRPAHRAGQPAQPVSSASRWRWPTPCGPRPR